MSNSKMIKEEAPNKNAAERLSKKQTRIILAVWIVALLVLFSAVIVYFCFKPVKVSFIDIGQGDSCLIRAGRNGNVLIDGGDEGAEVEISDFFAYNNIRRLNGVFISHFHSDHISGIAELIENDFPIDRVYIAGAGGDSDEKLKMFKLFAEKDIDTVYVKSGDIFKIGRAEYHVLWPDAGETAVSENNSSMVLKVSYGESDVLFTGDIEMPVIEELNQRYGELLKAEILKFPHHGGENSANAEFLANCNPEFAVISVGYDNIYDLPSDAALEILGKQGVPTLRTDRDGVIDVTLGESGIINIEHGNKWR